MKKNFIFLLLFSLIFLAVKCPQHNDPPKPTQPEVLPPATQTGANTYGCLVNGKVWLPGGGGISAIVPTFYKNEFFISAQKSKYDESNNLILKQIIYLDAKPVYDTGKYYFKNKNFYLGIGYEDQINNCIYKFNDGDSAQNWVHITKLDQVKLIVSGTFNIFLTETGCDTLRITQGRFDTKYSY